MNETKKITVGIGFATGRKSFQKVLNTYLYTWRESGIENFPNVSLNLFVAYDLKYSNTKQTDYTNVSKDLFPLLDNMYFIGGEETRKEIDYLQEHNIINEEEVRLMFGSGYAAKRNAVVYSAIKNKMDYLIFFDDDEYPMAVTKTHSTAIWGGQEVISSHLKHIMDADITNGHHCGYISPIPYIEFNNILKESDFRTFIQAISNDVLNWDSIKSVMNNGGVTYADTKILVSQIAEEVEETNHTKFITGANLCINLTRPENVSPFYNPPFARGEDTFLSTCLEDKKVLRIPCYTFHDGFSTYHTLMDGVLPVKLKYIQADSDKITDRFYHACIGWIRYKPLLLYITNPDNYDEKIQEMREMLNATIPKVCLFFNKNEFNNIFFELEKYHRLVKKHHKQFIQTQVTWKKVYTFLDSQNQ